MSEKPRVRVEGLAKKFCRGLGRSLRYGVADIADEMRPWRPERSVALRAGEFWALHDVSFELGRGEALGVLGANGAGKSTLLKLLDGLLKPDMGRITLRGRVGALIDLGAGFNPVLSGRENIYINAALLGLGRKETERVIDEIVDFAGIGDAIDAPVRSYSTGMGMRLGFAVATHLRPDVLLVDEVLAVGDLAFRRKCLQHIQRYLRSGGCLIFVSHDPWMIQCICSRGLLLDKGKIAYAGKAMEAVNIHFRLQLGPTIGSANPKSDPGVSRYFEGLQRVAGMDVAIKAAAASVESLDEVQECRETPNLASGFCGKPSRVQPDEANPIVIEKAEISALGGARIDTGKGVRIHVHYHSLQESTGVFWGFLIYTNDLSNCITAEASGFSFSDQVYKVKRGKGQFHCIIPLLPLIAGRYALKAFIGDPRTGVLFADLGFENAPIFFNVESEGDEKNNMYAIAESLIKMDVQWEEYP